jgi:hypothetical protein
MSKQVIRFFSNTLLVICLLCVGGMGAACSNMPPSTAVRKPPPANPKSPAAARANVLRQSKPEFPPTFFIVRQINQDGSQPARDRIVTTYRIQFEYPDFVNPALANLNRAVQDLVAKKRLELMNLAGFLDEEALRSPTLPWHSMLQYEVAYATNSFISLVIRTSELIGGATEQWAVHTFNFDADSGGFITLRTFLASGQALDTLSRRIRQELANELQGRTSAELLEQGTEPSWTNYENFVLTPAGITLFFLPGQIAPETEGILQISLAWSALEGLLNPEFTPAWWPIKDGPNP